MNLRKLCIYLSLSIFSSTSFAIEIESKVSDVIVYLDGAVVTRTADINLKTGIQSVTLVGFPKYIEANQLQVEIDNNNVRIGQVKLKENRTRDAQSSEINDLDQRIKQVELDIAILDDQTKSANLQLKFLDSLASGYAKQAWVGAAQATADTASWERALGLMQTGSAKSYKIIRDNAAKVTEFKKDLSLLKRQRSSKLGGELENSQVIVNLETDTPTAAKVKVHYYQEDAGWWSTYEARLDSETGKLQLAQKAVVGQSTEEPWLNANVVLSSSQTTADMQPPEVSSVFLDLLDKQPRYRSSAPKLSTSGPLEEIIVTAQKRTRSTPSNYSVNYQIPGLVTITNDEDQEQQFDLEKFEFSSELITQIVPRQSKQAFLTTRFTNNTPTPLYSSDMVVYVDNVLMGQTEIPNILPGAEVTLPMGVDRRIEVNVADKGGIGGDKGIIKKSRSSATNLVFEITNRRSINSNIEVRDVYPVSKNRALKVKINDDSTPPTENDENDNAGVSLWKKQLSAGETWEINFGYIITYPSDRKINWNGG